MYDTLHFILQKREAMKGHIFKHFRKSAETIKMTFQKTVFLFYHFTQILWNPSEEGNKKAKLEFKILYTFIFSHNLHNAVY